MLYIIVLNYKNYEDTIECLESILGNEGCYKVIVVDNNSPNDSMEKILEWANMDSEFDILPKWLDTSKKILIKEDKSYTFIGDTDSYDSKKIINEKIIFIQNNENKGFAAGNNVGIKVAIEQRDMEYCWILNNDTVIPQNSIVQLIEELRNSSKKKPTVGLWGTRLNFYHNHDKLQCLFFELNNRLGTVSIPVNLENRDYTLKGDSDKIIFPSGASMIVKRRFLDEVGLMYENYFLYFEELNWVLRGYNKRYQIDFLPNIVECLLENSEKEIAKVLNYIGINVDDEKVSEIALGLKQDRGFSFRGDVELESLYQKYKNNSVISYYKYDQINL